MLQIPLDKSKRKNDDKRKGLPRRCRLIFGILALVMIASIGIIMTRPRFTPMSDIPGHNLVYMEPGGLYELDFKTGQRSLTTYPSEPSGSYANEVSQDGRWVISFEWLYEEKISSLTVRDVTGQQPLRTLGRFGMFHGPINATNLSPDQKWFIFAADPLGSQAYRDPVNLDDSELWMVYIPTGEMTRLTNNSYRDSNPAFSPDGMQLAYISSASGRQHIYLMDVVTGQSRQLTPVSPTHAQTLLWSPDGQWIAYNVNQRMYVNATDYYFEIYVYVIRIDGAHGQRVAGGEKNSILVGWKP